MDWQNDTAFAAVRALIEEPRLGLVTALEGTLCPVVDNPEGAHVSPHCRSVLDGLADVLTVVAVISARPATDMRVRVELPNIVYAGIRGLEIWENGRLEIAPEAAAFREALEAAMIALYQHLDMQMQLEDTGSGLLVHYGQTSEPQAVAERLYPIVEEIAQQQGLRLFSAPRIFELRPPMIVDKGMALHHIINQYRLGGVIYIGDDTNDVAAVRMVNGLRSNGTIRGVAIGVTSSTMPDELHAEADFIVEGVLGVESLLETLLQMRTAWLAGNQSGATSGIDSSAADSAVE